MASLLDSEPAFENRATEHGLPADLIADLVRRGVNTLNKAAYAVGTPGTPLAEEDLRKLANPTTPATVTDGVLASIRRLLFESQTMSLANLRQQVEVGDGDRKKELPLEEIQSRIKAQKARLRGLELTGALEVSHAAYNLVFKMSQDDTITYLRLERFGTRAARGGPGKGAKRTRLRRHFASSGSLCGAEGCLCPILGSGSCSGSHAQEPCNGLSWCCYL